MKIFINVLVILLVGIPAFVVGYICAAARSGFETGSVVYDTSENDAIKRFVTKDAT